MSSRRVPGLLVLGMLIAITGSVAVALAPQATGVRTAMIVAALLMMAAGYLRVASDGSGWPRAVVRVIAVLHVAWVGWLIARPHVGELDDWHYRVLAATLWWSAIALLTVAACAWWRPTAWVVVAALAAVVLEALPWAPYLAPAFDELVEELPTVEPWIRPLRELLTSAAIVILVRAIPGSRAPRHAAAASTETTPRVTNGTVGSTSR